MQQSVGNVVDRAGPSARPSARAGGRGAAP